jgi:hypothetical protein
MYKGVKGTFGDSNDDGVADMYMYAGTDYVYDDERPKPFASIDDMTECPEFILNGMIQSIDGMDLYRHFEGVTPSRHLTIVFNLFVFF